MKWYLILGFIFLIVFVRATTVQLQDADTEILEDAYFDEDQSPDGTENLMIVDAIDGNGEISWIKFNLSSIPASNITGASFCFKSDTRSGISTYDLMAVNGSSYSLSWEEGTLDSGNTVTSIYGNMTQLLGSGTVNSNGVWFCDSGINISNYISGEIDSGNYNITFGFNGTDPEGDYFTLRSKEYVTVSDRPYLNVTYIADEAEADVTPRHFYIGDSNLKVQGGRFVLR